MELDDFSQAWKAFDQRLERQTDLTRQLLVERRLDRVRSGLRPLLVGLWFQALVGLGFAILAGQFWTRHFDVPALRWAGLTLHGFAIGMIVLAAPAILTLMTIDYAKPVVDLQRKLALLRFNQRRASILFGYAGCVIWVPMMLVAVRKLTGIDLYAAQPGFVLACLLSGGVFALLLAGFFKWASMPGREALRQRLDRGRYGCSLNRATAAVGEIERFTRDER
ncbi:hypothetical protein BH09PSE6_BH09PSE6_05900 [soil metagenome]